MKTLLTVLLLAALGVGAYFESENGKLKAQLAEAVSNASTLATKAEAADNARVAEIEALKQSLAEAKDEAAQQAAQLEAAQKSLVEREKRIVPAVEEKQGPSVAASPAPPATPSTPPVESTSTASASIKDIAMANHGIKSRAGMKLEGASTPVTLDDIKWVYGQSNFASLYQKTRHSKRRGAMSLELPSTVLEAANEKLLKVSEQNDFSGWLQKFVDLNVLLHDPASYSRAQDAVADLEKDYQTLVSLN